MSVIDIDVDGIEGLVKKVLEIASELPEGRFLWYRGLNCEQHALLPKIMRDAKTSDDVFDREMRLLTRFRQRSMAYWPAGYPQNDWEHLFAMQHYGIPTRLLDWSENLFIAAHFAMLDSSSHNHDNDCVPVIWCVDPINWNQTVPPLSEYGEAIQVLTTADEELEAYRPETNKRRCKSPIAMFGSHNSDRIIAQRGTFMVWGNTTDPLEGFASEQAAKLWKIKVNGNREQLSESLRQLGFSETMVFPELPSLSVELTRSEGWRS